MAKKDIEDLFEQQILDAKLPLVTREFKFHPTRRWRADFCFVRPKIICEIMGGVWSHGAHVRPLGYEGDCEKMNNAVILGYKVMYFTSKMVKDGRAIEWLKGII